MWLHLAGGGEQPQRDTKEGLYAGHAVSWAGFWRRECIPFMKVHQAVHLRFVHVYTYDLWLFNKGCLIKSSKSNCYQSLKKKEK